MLAAGICQTGSKVMLLLAMEEVYTYHENDFRSISGPGLGLIQLSVLTLLLISHFQDAYHCEFCRREKKYA